MLTHEPLIESRLYPSPNVSPTATVYTVPLTSIWAFWTPSAVKMSTSTTVSPPIVVLDPPEGTGCGLPAGETVGCGLEPAGAAVVGSAPPPWAGLNGSRPENTSAWAGFFFFADPGDGLGVGWVPPTVMVGAPAVGAALCPRTTTRKKT